MSDQTNIGNEPTPTPAKKPRAKGIRFIVSKAEQMRQRARDAGRYIQCRSGFVRSPCGGGYRVVRRQPSDE